MKIIIAPGVKEPLVVMSFEEVAMAAVVLNQGDHGDCPNPACNDCPKIRQVITTFNDAAQYIREKELL
jgi:hypothetical protein